MERLTKKEIIEETAEEYNSKNRATAYLMSAELAVCKYITENGKMCAVGRCMKNPVDRSAQIDVVYRRFGGDDLFKDEYKGHSVQFWTDLQNFHDTKKNWNKNGLSKRGETTKKHLIVLYGETT